MWVEEKSFAWNIGGRSLNERSRKNQKWNEPSLGLEVGSMTSYEMLEARSGSTLEARSGSGLKKLGSIHL